LKEAERLYLVLHCSPGIAATVFSALDKIVDNAPGRDTRARECAAGLRALLVESAGRPTVGNLILGLNMIRWRRFLTVSDLVDRAEGELVCPTAFACPDDVRLAINGFIERQQERLGSLVREQARLEAEAFSIVTEVLTRLHSIAQKLVARLTAAVPAGPSEENGAAAAGPIAFGDKTIRGQGLLDGKTVRDALRYAASIAFGIGLYLSDPALWGILRRESPLKSEFDGIMTMLERIAPAKIFEELRKKYSLP